ncbi:phenylalanyl-tRNA synthetase beta subunit [Dethiosulfatibacter aminovorans DSM 17477]|uniref:Phenylalanine--tRNA ligase beta subunit n=1 Tax=Dethiosulfatibacter aminovorans DSM 17477 TaxID=1121476 RepID=A0A1M6DLR2_9FIRM|nr:phenylalanine--tRNA ligase subunit beta [Dethiosulfatibacter aminovorans]SHI74257.1 phenylalanyl-tRNA synthetase beta subunit [Dethiosulfatibacter aminovorans DSM 17477]
MLVPVNWLKEYVDIDGLEIRTIADRLTMTGSHVDAVVNLDKDINNVVTGRIVEIENHPEADRLLVTKVDIGNKVVQIITGAKNIKLYDIVPVALHGSVLADGTKIKNSKLRGVLSEGMMCSYEELGIEDKLIPKESKDGILIFPDEMELGIEAKKALEMEGYLLDIEITFNRPDCLSVIGIAREAAAAMDRKLTLPEIKINNPVGNINDYINEIRIESPELCTRYYAKVIKDVKIGPSPLWLQRKIMDAGMRPISNIVDATNYVMLEMGQPLHAFDLEKMAGRKVVVRRAGKGEKLMTLDKETRELTSDMCVIADENDAQCIAGVMGGYDSEITDDTKLIIMECANFNPTSTRLTSKSLGLRSEASSRNEKPLSPQNVSYANERVCQIIEMIGAGTIVEGAIDAGRNEFEDATVELRPYRCTELLGVHIDTDEMVKILNSLEIESIYDGQKIVSKVPHFRPDIQQEADLIEEVGRIFGMERIEPKPLKGNILKGSISDLRKVEARIKNYLTESEFCETTTYSFISPKKYDKMNFNEDSALREYIKILNPLGEDFSSMRTTLLPNLVEVIGKNINYGTKKGRIYEIGNVFKSNEFPIKDLPDEISTLSLGMFGDADFYTIKGVLENIFNKFQIKAEYRVLENNPAFHPGRTAAVFAEGVYIGVVGEIHPIAAKNFNIKERVYAAEINLEKILELSKEERKYKEIPKYPSITRDMAVVAKDEVNVGDIISDIETRGYEYLESVDFFDIYKGMGIEDGHKSLAFSLVFRSPERTLQDEEVQKIFENIIKNVEDKFDAKLR